MIFFVVLSVCLAGCHYLHFPPIGPSNFPGNQLTQQQRFDWLLDSLDDAGADDLARMDAIRKYVGGKVDLGNSIDTIADLWTLDPFAALQGFDDDRLTAECGLTSVILAKLLDYAGMEAYWYHCGWQGDSSHKFTMVMIGQQLYIADGFYNFTVRNSGGFHHDFISLISEMKGNDFSNIVTDQVTLQSEFFVRDTAQRDSLFAAHGSPGTVDAMTCDTLRCRMLLTRNYDTFTGAAMTKLSPALISAGLPDNYMSLYLKPKKLKHPDGSNADSLLAVIQQAVL